MNGVLGHNSALVRLYWDKVVIGIVLLIRRVLCFVLIGEHGAEVESIRCIHENYGI